MARYSSAFFDAYNKQEDRISKKRKENRDAFLAYRKSKAELGEDVSAEELQRYRQSLAGNDAFFLRDLGPGEMLGDIAKRTNQRALDTRRSEEADEVKRKSEEVGMFDTWVGNNLNGDPTDKVNAKASFMQNFVGQENIGERLWSQNEGRFGEAILTKRAEAADAYVDLRLQNVRTEAAATAIMSSDNLPQWKKDSILNIIKNRASSDLTEAEATAEGLVNNYKGADMLYMEQKQLEDEATSIITQSKFGLEKSSQEYKDLHASIVARLTMRQSNAVTADTKLREIAFGQQALSKNSEFLVAFDALGYDDKKVFDAYNLMRRNEGLPVAENMQDPTFQQFINAAASREGIQYEADYNDAVTLADEKATTALTIAENKMKSMASTGFFEKDKLGHGVMAMMQGGYVPAFEPATVMTRLENQFGQDVLNGDYDPATATEVQDYLISSGTFVTKAEFKQAKATENMGLRVKPGTDIEEYMVSETAEFEGYTENVIQGFNNKLQIGASEEELSKAVTKIKERLEEQLTNDMRVYINSRGAFAEGPNGAIDGHTSAFEADIKQKIAEITNATLKPMKVPDGAFSNEGGKGKYKALAGSGNLIDVNGEPVVPNMYYTIEKGDIIPMDANSLNLPPPTQAGRRGTQPTQQLLSIGQDLANMNISQGRNQAIYGIRPNPAYAIRGGGPFDSVREWQGSIIRQMAERYRQSGTQISDRQLFNLFNQNGATLGNLSPFDFDA